MKKITIILLSLGFVSLCFGDTFISVYKPKSIKQKEEPTILKKKQIVPVPKRVVLKEDISSDKYWIQVGAFTYEEKAVARLNMLNSNCKKINIYKKDGLNKVVVGPFATEEVMYQKLKKLRELVKGAFLTHLENFK